MSELGRHLEIFTEPVRVRLLAALEAEELSVGELVRIVQLPQSTVSRHLKALKDAGWVARRAEGTAGWFRLDLDGVCTAGKRLWEVVRDDFGHSLQASEDQQRLVAVLESRSMDASTFFGRMHAQWDALRAELFGSDYLLPTLLSLMPPGQLVADLGCGTGEVVAALAPAVERVVGVDREPVMLRAAELRCAPFHNVELRQGGLEELPLGSAAFDAALLMLVLHHVEDPLAALREARRILRPRGRLVVLDMVAHDRADYRHTMGHLHLGFEVERVPRWADEAGFASSRVRPLPPASDASGPPLFLAVLTAP